MLGFGSAFLPSALSDPEDLASPGFVDTGALAGAVLKRMDFRFRHRHRRLLGSKSGPNAEGSQTISLAICSEPDQTVEKQQNEPNRSFGTDARDVLPRRVGTMRAERPVTLGGRVR